MGIIVARDGATLPWAACNICNKRVIPGLQRIIVDDRFEDQWWNHLECARLDLFIEDEHDTNTSPTVASKNAQCAWCTQLILCGRHQWHANWMGWTHAHCNVGNLSDFVNLLRTLQRKYPGEAMPTEVHSWRKLEDLKKWAGVAGSIPSSPEAQSLAEACALMPDLEDDESVTSDTDSQATQIYEPVLCPTTPAQPVRAAVGG